MTLIFWFQESKRVRHGCKSNEILNGLTSILSHLLFGELHAPHIRGKVEGDIHDGISNSCKPKGKRPSAPVAPHILLACVRDNGSSRWGNTLLQDVINKAL